MLRWFGKGVARVGTAIMLSILAGCGTIARTQETVIPDAATTSETITQQADSPSLSLPIGDEIALRAIALVGKPYRYGGADLQGFDCSGMVYFIHQALGFEVPRTAAEQQHAALRVAKSELRPGDLLFFKTTRSKRVSHVGVYVGDNRFVHAPQSGKLIELKTLDDQYYGPRFISSGRLYPNS